MWFQYFVSDDWSTIGFGERQIEPSLNEVAVFRWSVVELICSIWPLLKWTYNPWLELLATFPWWALCSFVELMWEFGIMGWYVHLTTILYFLYLFFLVWDYDGFATSWSFWQSFHLHWVWYIFCLLVLTFYSRWKLVQAYQIY